MKIKYCLVHIEKALVFQVVEMDKRFLMEEFEAENGWTIRTSNFPEIMQSRKDIYLHGCFKENSLVINEIYFSSNKERDKIKNEIHEALKDWSENWPRWNDTTKQGTNELLTEL